VISRPHARLAPLGFLLSGLVISFAIGGFVTGCGGSSKGGASSTGVTAISAGGGYTCALFSGGTVKCWGLGVLTGPSKHDRDSSVPVVLSGIKNAKAIWDEGFGLEVLLRSGKVMTIAYQGGDKNVPAPSRFTGVTASAGNGGLTCAVQSDKTVECYGDNSVGQLGNGEGATGSSAAHLGSSKPVAVSGITNATAINVGRQYGCALLSGGTVECWGFGRFLGDGVTDHGHYSKTWGGDFSPTPVVVSGITNAVAISTGLGHTCALLSDGTVKCWGFFANHGMTGSTEYHSTPVRIAGITNASAISSAQDHNCALISGGSVKCWGSNKDGQLGNGTMKDSPTPVTVNGITNASAISASDFYTCALLSGGTVKCWGVNYLGQLGDGTTKGRSTPVSVVGLTS
jgi:hypothetical protein